MKVIEPKEIIEEIYNLRTGEKYKNDEEWKAKGIPESEIRKDVRVIMPSLDLFGETKQNGTMAITRAQQAKQMLQDGGRIGLKKGTKKGRQDPMGGKEGFTAAEIRAADPIGYGGGLTGPIFQGGGGDGPKTTTDVPLKKPPKTKDNFRRQFVAPTLAVLNFLSNQAKNTKFVQRLNAIQRQNYLENLKETNPELYEATVDDLEKLGYAKRDVELYGPIEKGAGKDIETFTDLYEDQAKSILNTVRDSEDGGVGTLYDDYLDEQMNRFTPKDRDGPQPLDPCKGPNPPAYCFIGEKADETIKAQRNLAGLTPRIGGGLFNFDGPQFAADGGRIGLAKGSYSRSYNPGAGGVVQHSSVSTNIGGGGGGGNGSKTTSTNVGGGGGGVTTLKTRKDIKTPSDFTRFDLKDLVNLKLMDEEDEDMKLAKTYSTEDIEKLLGIKDQKTAEQFVQDPIIGSPEFIGDKSQANIMEKFRENLLEQETKFPGKDFDAQRAGALSFGISPTNQSLVPSDFLDKPGEAATQMPFSTIAKEIEAKYPMAEGGIAGLDREAFLLGGIAKGLKKAVRGLKKVAKSPIGKVALLAAPFAFSPAARGAIGSFFGKGSFSPFKAMLDAGTADAGFGPSGLGRLLGKIFVDQSTGSLTGLSKILIPSLAAGLMTKKQPKDEFDLASYYAQNQLTPSQSIRGMGSEFDFYGGQRMRVADGGDVEPVAKKTMPLLDMDGKEKDYRETGGFVDMGRMERADDVPARLSKNEFVFTADAVRNAGEGDIDKGAEVMYNMMKNLEAGGEVSEESQGLEGAREMFQTSQRLGEVI